MTERSKQNGEAAIAQAPEQSARQAGLRYVRDDAAGIYRRRCGRGFTYVDGDGTFVRGDKVRTRIDRLAIPPAWTDVWICPVPNGHLQATGRDAEGRKQYIYHPDWEQVRSETKFNRIIAFGDALGQLRARCEHDLRLRTLSREKVLAAVVSLLDRTLIRIGNQSYAKQNGSFGLTTLRDRHVDVSGGKCTFVFRGKSGKEHCIELNDRRLARIVRACRDIPGYDLFQYYDEAGARRTVDSSDVNTYLQETTGQPFTAKDFRTWGGTVQAAVVLSEMGEAASEKEAQQHVVDMVRAVSERLGNTTAVCRQYYIHPAIVDAYLAGTFLETWRPLLDRDPPPQLEPQEGATLRFLHETTPS